MSVIASLLARVGADTSGFQSEMEAVNRTLATAASKAQASLEGFNRLGQSLTNVGTRLSVALTAPIVALAGVSLKAAGDIDSLKRGLTAVAGSASEAEKEFKKLLVVAKLPGLGMKEAVQGAINMKALGFSFDDSRKIMLSFGNALATVGRGREDLNEVIRQLGQMAARGKVTADNLKPIIERVPQVAEVIKKHFGANAIGDPAKEFERLGVSAAEFIEVITAELGKLPQVTGGIKNSFENLRDSADAAFAQIGDSIITATNLDKRINDLGDGVTRLAHAFGQLSPVAKTTTVAVLGFAAAIGPVVLVSGQLVQSFTAIIAAVRTMAAALSLSSLALSGHVGLIVAAVAALGTLAYSYLNLNSAQNSLNRAQKESADVLIILESKLRSAGVNIAELSKQYRNGEISVEDYRKKLITLATAEGNRLAQSRGVVTNLKELAETQRRAAEAAAAAAKGALSHAEAQKRLAESAKRQDAIVDANIAMLERYDLRAKETIETFRRFDEQTKQLADAQFELSTVYAKSHEAIRAESIKTEAIVIPLYERIPLLVQNAVTAAKRLQEAFKESGADKIVSDSSVQRARENFDLIAKSGKATAAQLLRAWVMYEEARQDMARASGTVIATENQKALDDAKKKLGEIDGVQQKVSRDTKTVWTEIQREVKRAFDGMARGMADSIVKWKGFGDTLKSIAQEFASGILEIFIQRLLDPLQKKLEKVLGGIFGGDGGKPGIINNAVSGAGSAGGGIGGGGGAAAAGGLAGGLTAAFSGVSAVSGVIGNFQMAGMNKTLDLLEKEARFSQIHLRHILENTNMYLPELTSIRSYLWDSFNPSLASLMSTVERMASGEGQQKIQLVVDGKVLAEALARVLPRHSGAFA